MRAIIYATAAAIRFTIGSNTATSTATAIATATSLTADTAMCSTANTSNTASDTTTTAPAFTTAHSALSSRSTSARNFAVLPLRTKFRGPAYPSNEDYDIIDEILDLFRANSFFRNFEIKGPADRTLIYGILFISDCLNKLKAATTSADASRLLNTLSVEHFSIPGDPGFPLNSLYAPPKDRNEVELLTGYLTQFRQELAQRLIERLYKDSTVPNKYWLAFTRRKFMNKSLS